MIFPFHFTVLFSLLLVLIYLRPLWNLFGTTYNLHMPSASCVCTRAMFVQAHKGAYVCVCTYHFFIQKILLLTTVTLKGMRASVNVKDNHFLL